MDKYISHLGKVNVALSKTILEQGFILIKHNCNFFLNCVEKPFLLWLVQNVNKSLLIPILSENLCWSLGRAVRRKSVSTSENLSRQSRRFIVDKNIHTLENVDMTIFHQRMISLLLCLSCFPMDHQAELFKV